MNRIANRDPIFLEVVITAIVAFILLFLHEYELMIVATSVQILISFMTYSIPLKIKNDVSESYKNIGEHSKILKFSISIEEEPFKKIKDKIIKDCENQLELLMKGSVKGDIYYEWLYEKINQSNKTIKAISSMDCEQWNENPNELAYYVSNRNARINRNCDVERIFVVNINKLKDGTQRRIILKHLLDGIRIYIVPASQNGKISDGMCIFDDKLILIDEVVPPSGAGGRLVMVGDKDFIEYVKEYDRIKLGSRLIEDLDRLSEVSKVNIKILLEESCGIINETYSAKVFEDLDEKIQIDSEDKLKIHYYNKWNEFCKRLNNGGDLNET